MPEILEEAKTVFEKHPYLIGGAAVVVVVLIAYSYSSSASAATSTTAAVTPAGTATTATPDDSLIEAELSAGTQSAATQYQAQLANNQLQAQLQSQQMTDATQITLAQIAKGVPVSSTPVNTPVSSTPVSTPVSNPPASTGIAGCSNVQTICDANGNNCFVQGCGEASLLSSVSSTLFGGSNPPLQTSTPVATSVSNTLSRRTGNSSVSSVPLPRINPLASRNGTI